MGTIDFTSIAQKTASGAAWSAIERNTGPVAHGERREPLRTATRAEASGWCSHTDGRAVCAIQGQQTCESGMETYASWEWTYLRL
jgi:4'-phosphopantetheinyl transferase EntD